MRTAIVVHGPVGTGCSWPRGSLLSDLDPLIPHISYRSTNCLLGKHHHTCASLEWAAVGNGQWPSPRSTLRGGCWVQKSTQPGAIVEGCTRRTADRACEPSSVTHTHAQSRVPSFSLRSLTDGGRSFQFLEELGLFLNCEAVFLSGLLCCVSPVCLPF